MLVKRNSRTTFGGNLASEAASAGSISRMRERGDGSKAVIMI